MGNRPNLNIHLLTISAIFLVVFLPIQTVLADNNPVGTWEGTDGVGDAINLVLRNDGTVEGTWEE